MAQGPAPAAGTGYGAAIAPQAASATALVAEPVPARQPAPAERPTGAASPGGRTEPRAMAEQVGPAERTELPAAARTTSSPTRPRGSARRRLATERFFGELAGLAAISVDSYAIGEEVEGALCLVQTEDGFEVFHSADGNRHELQFFRTEEAACFYLFGVLAADAVRNGALEPTGRHLPPLRPLP